MSKGLFLGFLISTATLYVAASGNDFANCNCDDEGFWTAGTLLECQRVSDFFIAIAYFSIPIELLYFLSRSNVPFKWVLLQFIAFIVLCGLTHLINGWTYYGPHTFLLILWLTIAKFFTALVSCATAITLLTLIPILLKVKVRELFLRQSVLELDQEVGMMKKQTDACLHVRMLTREIRKSLDRHTILYTTLVELSKTLVLQNCAVWMMSSRGTEMNLTHELKRRSATDLRLSISVNDLDVIEIRNSKGIKILRPDSALGAASSGGSKEYGSVAAIRMPMLHVSNFKGGTPEQTETGYAILVLVLPSMEFRAWSYEEMEIIEVVADQVAVALSHAAILEESHMMREKLREQNRALQLAKRSAMMASEARNSFQKVMSHGMRRPMHTILGLLSMIQDDNGNSEQKMIVDTMVKTASVVSTLINDVMDISEKDTGKFPLNIRTFQLHSMIRDASCLAKWLCFHKGFGFAVDVQNFFPNHVMGDEIRIFQVILHMVGYLLNTHNQGGSVVLRLSTISGSESKKTNNMWSMYKGSTPNEYARLRVELEINDRSCPSDSSVSTVSQASGRHNSNQIKEGLSFSICKKLVQMMQGDIQISSNSLGLARRMILVLGLQIQTSFEQSIVVKGNSFDQPVSFKGLKVVLADDDDVNRSVTKKLLEKLGCQVSAVSSGFECLSALTHAENPFRVVILDLHMPEMDGFDVAMRIRKFRSRNWPLIIALTASVDENIWQRCLQSGMNGVIRKPVLLQGMADELRRVLQRANEGV